MNVLKSVVLRDKLLKPDAPQRELSLKTSIFKNTSIASVAITNVNNSEETDAHDNNEEPKQKIPKKKILKEINDRNIISVVATMEIEVKTYKLNTTTIDATRDNDNALISIQTIRTMKIEEVILKIIPAAWTLLFETMLDELEHAGKIIENDLKDKRLLPDIEDIYNSFVYVSPDNVKVVILGMDPYLQIYNGVPVATGRSFECRADLPIERSLSNILTVCFKTIEGFKRPKNGDLSKWVEQGVLLLNTALTTKEKKSGAHIGPWSFFPEKVIRFLGEKKKNIVYMFWGKDAGEFIKFVPERRNLVLTASHPVARGHTNTFLDCDHFNEANKYLEKNGRIPINWIL